MALNIELRHLCQLENRGDRWCNSIFKQVVRAMYVPKNNIFFAIFCAGLHHFSFLNIKLPLGDMDGASPTHSPKSGWECPHRWRKSLLPPDIPKLAMLHLFPVICRRSVESKMCSLPNTISSSCHLLCDYSLVIMSGRCRYHVHA